MAHWNHQDRTIFAKLVYYGPAFCGKTTNLEALHRITDPEGIHQLLSVKTEDDRTLYFDLLPLDLGQILGYRVAIKAYTVPGQVRYEATRRVVLAGADAVVFVADSSRGRKKANRESLQGLARNLKAKGIDPSDFPVLLQFNKQDLPEAAPPEEVAGWLGARAEHGRPAVAIRAEGVLETFVAATRHMLERLVDRADPATRARLDRDELREQVERAFEPHFARLRRVQQEGASLAAAAEDGGTASIVSAGRDLKQHGLEVSLQLGEKLAEATARANRLEREADALRNLGETLRSVGASFDQRQVVTTTLEMARKVLGASTVSLVCEQAAGRLVAEGVAGEQDPLLGSPEGCELVGRLMRAGGSCLIDDLAQELEGPDAASMTQRARAVAAARVGLDPARTLLAYAPPPDRKFGDGDVRFLATLAGHLSAGLDRVRMHAELTRHRDRLENTVQSRTEQLREAYDDLRGLERMKDRFISNLSHEMKSPLTGILSSATFLRNYEGGAEEREEMLDTIVGAAGKLQQLVEDLFRLVQMESEPGPLELAETDPERLVADARKLVESERVEASVDGELGAWVADRAKLARAVGNLLDNAVKFSPEDQPIEVRISPARIHAGNETLAAVAISVLDRGPGVAPRDRDRIFEPFEQGGEVMTGKPAGIGLGLHEAKTIVEQHGGSLEHRPRRGGGSEFRVRVPLEPESSDRPLEAVGG